MKLKNLVISALAGALALSGAVIRATAAESRPNIIHIVADDLGWKDVGFNGCTDIKTPNIDALAAGGAKFTQFYVQPMCTPTRAALMTGRYPFRYGLQTIVIPGPAGYGLDTTEWLMPQALKEAGYNTAIIGKWHLGHADMKYWPKQRGFDYQYGAMIGELDYNTHGDAGVLDWFRNNQPVHEKGYTTQLIGADAVKYINGQDASKPFYLYLTRSTPLSPTSTWAEAMGSPGRFSRTWTGSFPIRVRCKRAIAGSARITKAGAVRPRFATTSSRRVRS